jgi:hypothetical protein
MPLACVIRALLLVGLLTATTAPLAGAASPHSPAEVWFGLLGHDSPGPDVHHWETPRPFDHRTEGGANLDGELVWRPANNLGWIGRPRPLVGIAVNTQGATSYLYGGLAWRTIWRRRLLAGAYFGLAVHNGKLEDPTGERLSLGTRALFRWGWELGAVIGTDYRLTLLFEHLSNGGITTHNDGLTCFGLRFGYRLSGDRQSP